MLINIAGEFFDDVHGGDENTRRALGIQRKPAIKVTAENLPVTLNPNDISKLGEIAVVTETRSDSQLS